MTATVVGENPTTVATTAEVLAGAVRRQGCSHVFGLMGDGNMHFLIALQHRGVEVVEVRHESAAVAMAEGYGWSSGGVGICSVTHGPGLTHTATSLVVAARNRSPLVLLVAETPAGYQGAQRFDQEAFVAACEAPYRRLSAGEDPAAVLDEVFEQARLASRPVVLGVAADLLTGPAAAGDDAPGDDRAPAGGRTPARPAATDVAAAARALLDALAQAERPVLIAGRGALAGRTRALATAVADRYGAGLATTLPAKGLFDGHPLDLGIAGGLSHPAAERLLREADLVVAVGASMGRSTTQSQRLFRGARVLQVAREAVEDGAGPGVEVLAGDAEETLGALLELASAQSTVRQPWFPPVGSSQECWEQDLRDFSPEVPAGTVDPRRALAAVSAAIPPDAVVVVSNGHCSGFVSAFVTTPPRGRWFTAQGFGSIGQALPSAIGAACGAPGRKVVVFEGDAAFMMHAQEVESAARAGVDLTLFVLNDQALGTEYQRLLKEGDDAHLAVIPPPDLANLGRALGARAWTIDGREAATAVEEALQPGLALVEVRTARSVLSRHMRLGTAGSERGARR
ncbi:thiamine pyrophosphate-binding protein [Kineococcus arenarius]|uniref:thiamine pyrophosphate-binding protein n=1 Tax=Kineococcus sp. SYSU DK019 TaxID=3383140 RepID=UPI003D7CFC12